MSTAATIDTAKKISISSIDIEYSIERFISTCTQFSFPISDIPEFTDGNWEDNSGNVFADKWKVIDEGVATANDNNHVTYPSQIG